MQNISDYERWKAQRQQQGVAAANVVIGSVAEKPDEVAADLTLASDFGRVTGKPVPPRPLVQGYRNVFQQAIERERNTTILSGAPRLTKWLLNPENAALARDGLEGLAWWETTLGAVGSGLSRGIQSFPQSYNQLMANEATERFQDQQRSFGSILGDELAVRGGDGEIVSQLFLPGPGDLFNAGSRFIQSRMAELAGTDQQEAAAYYQQQAGEVARRISETPMSPAGGRYREVFAQIEPSGDVWADLGTFVQTVADDPGGFLAFIGEVAVESFPQLAAGAAVGLATRSPTAGAAVMGGMSATREMGVSPVEFFRERGVDVSTPEGALAAVSDPALMREAADRGAIRGVVIGIMDGLSGGVAGQQLVASPVGNMVLQSFVQAAMGATGEASAQIAAGQEFNIAEVLIEGLAEFAGAPLEVAGMGGSSYLDARRKAKDAEARRALFQELSGQAVASPLRNRMPDRFRDFVATATANGPIENVYIPADQFTTYFQGIGVDPYALIDEMEGVTRDDLDAAMAGGGDLQIPTATYAAKIAGSEHDAFLMENMRFDPDAFTAAEATEFNARAQEALEEAWEVAETIRTEQEGLRTFEQEIYDTMVSRLRTAGRSTDVATSEAALFPAFYRVMAERSGMAIDEFMAAYPLPEVRGDLPQGLQARNVDELTRTLEEARNRRATGLDKRRSLLEFVSDYGGIDDPGGELRARDAEVIKRGRGRKTLRLARSAENGGADLLGAGADGRKHGWDDVAQAAIEAGYLPDDPVANEYRAAIEEGRQPPEIGAALIAAIEREMRGEAQFSAQDAPPADAENDAALDEIEAYLNEIGLSLDDDDAAIRAAIEADDSGRRYAQFAALAAETADTASYTRARTMAQQGATRDEIYDATGWFKGPDERWRFEISDADAKLNMTSADEIAGARVKFGLLAGVLWHKNLYAAYPRLRRISTEIVIQPTLKGNGSGSFDLGKMRIEVAAPTEEKARSILLHEVAHAIQDIEGFAQGGSPSMGESYEGERVEFFRNDLKQLEADFDVEVAKPSPDMPKLEQLNKSIEAAQRGLVRAARYEFYRRIAGEVEARNVQKRDKAQRRADEYNRGWEEVLREDGVDPNSPEGVAFLGEDWRQTVDAPWWTADVPADQVIIVRSQEAAGAYEALSVGAAETGVTETDAFKRWFDKSLVIDGDGEPMVVHHWTYSDFDTFDRMAILQTRVGKGRDPEGIDRIGNWFTDNKEIQYAAPSMGGKRIDVYLSIQKPLWLDDGVNGKDSFTQLDEFIKTNGGATATRELLRDQGYDGIIMTGTDLDGANQNVFIAFDPEQIKSVDNRGTFDAADPRFLFQSGDVRGARGSIQFPGGGVGNGDTVIRLFEGADLSTFLHESGHYFLTVMQDLAAKGEAQAGGDYSAVKEWWHLNADAVAKDAMRVMPDANVTADDVRMALDGGGTGDVLKDAAIDVGMQEQWARAFEAYLMDGKAPSVELRGAFEKFRAWLLSVYRRLRGLDVSVSDDLRRVFDRMLATDEEIAKAQSDAGGTGPLFATAEGMGLTPEEYANFLKLRAQSEDEAKARLMGEIMAPIRREQEKWFKDERAKARDEVERQVNAGRQYRAIEWMGNRRWLGQDAPEDMPDIRLSKRILVDRYGEGVLKTLPRGKQTVYAVEGGIDPDDAAGWFGFDSGDEMIRAMETAQPRREAIEAETDKVMLERHGDPLNDGSVEAAALDAVHTDKRGQWIAAELNAVVEIAGSGERLTAKEARASARATVARMRVRDAMNANRFLSAERKAGEEAARLGAILARERIWMDNARRRIGTKARAVVRGEGEAETVAPQIERANRSTGKFNETVEKLIAAKRRQLINHALYTEARKVAAEVEKAERFVAKLGKKTTREKIAGAGRRENAQVDYLAAIDELVERYDFRRMSGAAEQRRGALAAFVEAMKLAGRENELAIPEAVLRDAGRKPYKTLPVEELRGVIDSLKNLEHIALRWNKLIDGQRQRELDATVEDIVAAFDTNVKKRPPGRVATKTEAARNTVRQFLDLVLNAGTILREIDGFADLGAAYRNIKSPIDEAMDRLTVRREKAADDLDKLYAVYSKAERRSMAVREHIPSLGYALSKWERIAVALNAGNAGNFSRLTDRKVRGSLTEDQVRAVLATLDERDADFVQSVWDYVGTFREDIAARERRTTGVEPAWVEPQPVEIAGKTLRGGYYPLKYDPRLSSLARDDETQEIAQSLQAGRFGKAQTRNGHTKARAQSSGRDVELDMSVLHRHVNQVIYDLELSEPVANSWRVLQNGRIRAAFMDAGKQPDFDALEMWLLDVGNGELRSSDLVGRGARMLKSNFTAAKLAFNLSTVAVQITGLSQSMVVVGKRDMATGISQSLRPNVRADISAKSTFMRSRETTFNKDIFDFYNDPKLGPAASRWGDIKREIIGPASFWLMTKVQWHLVDVPTWLAGYGQGLRRFGGDESKAVAHADAVVKRAQASGMFSDRSAVERGTRSKNSRQSDLTRLFTALGSYMFAKFNVAYERSSKAGRVIGTEGVSARSAQEALSWTLDMAFLFTFEAILIAVIKGRLPDDEDEDDDGWLAFLAKETGLGVLGTIPFVRDAASAVSGFEGGGAYGAITKEFAAPFLQAAQGEVDAGLVRSVINATGLATGLPSTQVNRIADAGLRQAGGEDVSPLEYLLGRMGK